MSDEDNGGLDALAHKKIKRLTDGDIYPVEDVVAREEPLEIRLNGTPLVYLMRLPGEDRLLAVGFCLSEGIIRDRSQIKLIRHCSDGLSAAREATGSESGSGNPADNGTGPSGNETDVVEIEADLAEGVDRFAHARVIRTGCGGADLAREIDLDAIEVRTDAVFAPETILRAPGELLAAQEVFRRTGGTHAAALFDPSGTLGAVMEDVGRHNAVDKALGHMVLSGENGGGKGLMLSGRLSYEMVLKAGRAGIPLVCSVSAPTALGIDVGERIGVTLVGFVRGAGFNIYTHPSRVGGA